MKLDLERIQEQYTAPYIIGYGSWVFAQPGSNPNQPKMIDLILWVDNPWQWHAQNLQTNAKHYAYIPRGLQKLGLFGLLQDTWAKIYYNPYVKLDETTQLKYGVIALWEIEKDLLEWTTLYVAGRLQKPTLEISGDGRLDNAKKQNLVHAISVAMSFLPEIFTMEELFLQIARLSYLWDFRGKYEAPGKIQSIVEGSKRGFEEMYTPLMIEFSHRCIEISNGVFRQDFGWDILAKTLSDFPLRVQEVMYDVWYGDIETFRNSLKRAIVHIVASSSRAQSLKWIISAGPISSAKYVVAKIKKSGQLWAFFPTAGETLKK